MKVRSTVCNRLRQFMKLNPDSTTIFFKEHEKAIKDGSTMRNARGFKFEKKKEEPIDRDRHFKKKEYQG